MVVLWVSDSGCHSATPQVFSEPTLGATSDVDGQLYKEMCRPPIALEGARGVTEPDSVPRAAGHTCVLINLEPSSAIARAPSSEPPPGDGDNFTSNDGSETSLANVEVHDYLPSSQEVSLLIVYTNVM